MEALSSCELIKQGAEARVYRGRFQDKPVIVKERFPKTYRLPALDQKLSQRRMNQEVRSMARCRKHGIRVPEVYRTDTQKRLIYMEDISDGVTLKEHLQLVGGPESDASRTALMEHIGQILAKMHDFDIIHGDLTTSNMIYDRETNNLTLIDFGLSFVSGLAEDKGVDLYVLERAFLSTHPNTEELFQRLLDSYSRGLTNSKSVIQKLDEVRLRGRKRNMVG